MRPAKSSSFATRERNDDPEEKLERASSVGIDVVILGVLIFTAAIPSGYFAERLPRGGPLRISENSLPWTGAVWLPV